jgi:DNA polymerase III epsilon subunit family exonuclease
MSLKIDKPCPQCKKEDCVIIDNNTIQCTTAGCKLNVAYNCPICEQTLNDNDFTTSEKNIHFNCPNCRNTIPIKKMKYLIENNMSVDYKTRCEFCNNPTIHRTNMNMGNRCFFFPKCSGQADLFGGQARETLTFIDFETTGLNAGKDSIIEIGALKIDEEGDEHSFLTFVSPPHEISDRITKITGITNDMLIDAPEPKPTLEKLIEFLGNSKLIAHNTDFDMPFLLSSCIMHNITISNLNIICTLKWARSSSESRASLGALAKKYNIMHQNAHRALADAATTKELFFIFESLKELPRPTGKLYDYMETAQKMVEKYNRTK